MQFAVEIALAANGPYFCGMLVTACSIAKSARKEYRLSFNILDGGIDDDDYAFMVRRVQKYHEDSVFNRLPIMGDLFKDCLLWHGNHMTYARLMLPQLLPKVDYCIYCDVDFLWLRDIAELWEERASDVALISTYDGNTDTMAQDGGWLKANGFPFEPESYFCAGLTFFNLKYFRENNSSRKCFDVLRMKPPFNDQTALYVATYGHQKLVEKMKWQVFTYELTDQIVKAGCVVHHAGEIPWKPVRGKISLLSDGILLWHRLNAEINGITVWQSLRRYNSAGGIIYHRALYYLLRTPVLRQVIRFALCSAGKLGVWRMFECRSRKFGWGGCLEDRL